MQTLIYGNFFSEFRINIVNLALKIHKSTGAKLAGYFKYFQQTSWLGNEFCIFLLDLWPLRLADIDIHDFLYWRIMHTF